ncbi:MAG: tetratricopeptide repeat protein [Thermoguttaceae bacterium]
MHKLEQYVQINTLLTAGKISEAREAIEKARDVLPPGLLLECFGDLCFYRREFQEAIDKYEEAITTDSSCHPARYQYLVGVQNEREGNYVDAFNRYQDAIETEPTFVDAYVELGGLLAKAGDIEGALTCYTDAVRLDPGDLRNFWNRAQVLKRLCETDAARYRDAFRVALKDYNDAKARLPPVGELVDWKW